MTGMTMYYVAAALVGVLFLGWVGRYVYRVIISAGMVRALGIVHTVPGVTPEARRLMHVHVYKAVPVKTWIAPPPVTVTVRAYRAGKEVRPHAHD